MTNPPGVIDFHVHHIPGRFDVTAGHFAPPSQRARWQVLAQHLADEALLLKDIRDGHLDARVVNIPAQLIADADGRVPHETIVAINEETRSTRRAVSGADFRPRIGGRFRRGPCSARSRARHP